MKLPKLQQGDILSFFPLTKLGEKLEPIFLLSDPVEIPAKRGLYQTICFEILCKEKTSCVITELCAILTTCCVHRCGECIWDCSVVKNNKQMFNKLLEITKFKG